MSFININKFKSIFKPNQKEVIQTSDGKRNLYFDYQRKNYIKFTLDVATTCESIFNTNKEQIKNKIKEMYGNDVNLDNFGFLIVELNPNQYEQNQNLINVKLRLDDKIIFQILLNEQLMLCYFKIIRQNITLKRKERNLGSYYPNNLEIITEEKFKEKKKPDDIRIYYQKNSIYYYNSFRFSKEKIKITGEEIHIFSKESHRILIKDIRATSVFSTNNENEAKKYLNNCTIYGEKPLYCLEIITKDDKKLLLGRNSYNSFMSFYSSLDAALYNYQNQYSSININKKILSNNNNLCLISKEIMKKIFPLYDLIYDKNKKNMFFKDKKEKELADIMDIIIDLKKILNSQKYIDILLKIKNLVLIVRKLLKEKKFQDFINEKNTTFLKEMWKKINKLCKNENELNETKNTFNDKLNLNNEKELTENNKKSINNNKKQQNNGNTNMQQSKDKIKAKKSIINKDIKLDDKSIKELKYILDIKIFDNLYSDIKQKYINKNYVKEQKSNFKINSNIKLIFANYFSKNFQMKNDQDYLYLCGNEIEKTIDAFNVEYIKNKKELIDI